MKCSSFQKILLMFLIIGISTSLYSQKSFNTINISTSATKVKAQEMVENALAVERGVKRFEFKENSGKIEVKYSSKKTSPEKIRKVISEIGFDADDIKANPKAVSLLPVDLKPSSGCGASCGASKKIKKKASKKSCCGPKKSSC